MNWSEYLAIDAVSWSALKELRRSPLHYQHRQQTTREDVDALRLGRAAHCAVFEPEQFSSRYVTWPGNRRAGKSWDAFQAEHAGKTSLTRFQFAHALGIATAVREHPVAAKYLERGQAEVPIQWQDRSGLGCKARLDWVATQNLRHPSEAFVSGLPYALVDLKTSATVDERRFAAVVARYGYAAQMAMYRTGWQTATGGGRELPCVLIAVETLPPHDVAVYRMSEDALYAGQEEVQELLARLVACRTSGLWPGRYPEEVELELPAWSYPEEDPNESPGVRWLMSDEEGVA